MVVSDPLQGNSFWSRQLSLLSQDVSKPYIITAITVPSFKWTLKKTEIGNEEWTIQWNWQHWVDKTQDGDKTKHRKLKQMNNTYPIKNQGWTHVLANGNQFLILIRQPIHNVLFVNLLSSCVRTGLHNCSPDAKYQSGTSL